MPVLYHGARQDFAVAMVGPPGTIDVTRGSGEFGRGFYTQNSKANAMMWAANRFGRRLFCVLQLDIDDDAYFEMRLRFLDHKRAARLDHRLRNSGAVATYLLGVDVVVGPVKGRPRIEQQKFESIRAQNLLNGLNTRRSIR